MPGLLDLPSELTDMIGEKLLNICRHDIHVDDAAQKAIPDRLHFWKLHHPGLETFEEVPSDFGLHLKPRTSNSSDTSPELGLANEIPPWSHQKALLRNPVVRTARRDAWAFLNYIMASNQLATPYLRQTWLQYYTITLWPHVSNISQAAFYSHGK
jgi:hypothetical protein